MVNDERVEEMGLNRNTLSLKRSYLISELRISGLAISVLLFTFLFVLICPPTVARADYIHPGNVHIKTASYEPSAAEIPEGRYNYSIRWQGLPVAKSQIDIRSFTASGKKFYSVEAHAESGSVIDLFYRLRHQSESLFSAGTFQPSLFSTHQTENSKESMRQIYFNQTGDVEARVWKSGKPIQQIEFQSQNPVFDPISAAFLAKSLPIAVGADVSFDVFNGKHRYLISFHVDSIERIRYQDHYVKAFKVVPRVQKLTDSEGETRLNSAALWISADEQRNILRLESDVWVGSVSAELASFTPSPSASPEDLDLRRARLKTPGTPPM